MKSNLSWFERFVRLVLGLIALFAAITLFEQPWARFIVGLFALLAFFETVFGICFLARRTLELQKPSNEPAPAKLFFFGLAGMQLVLGYEWWSAGWEKISSDAFVDGIGKTLEFFASKNPFPWYKEFLLGFVARNTTIFAYAVEWSQILIAVTLAAAIVFCWYASSRKAKQWAFFLSVVALFGGLLMNANFYLAAGWTGPGTKGSNVVMFWMQMVLIYVWLKSIRNKQVKI